MGNYQSSSEVFYMHLGKSEVEYTFSSMKRAKQVSNLVEIAESLGLSHSQNFVDTVAIPVNSSFYISQDWGGNLYMVGKYSDCRRTVSVSGLPCRIIPSVFIESV